MLDKFKKNLSNQFYLQAFETIFLHKMYEYMSVNTGFYYWVDITLLYFTLLLFNAKRYFKNRKQKKNKYKYHSYNTFI